MSIFNEELETIYIEEQYTDYINKHKSNLMDGYNWFCQNLPEVIDKTTEGFYTQLIRHDDSKYTEEEFMPYANYFYGNKTEQVEIDFDYAWNHHQKCNPHHYQYWILIKDEDGVKCLDMPYDYVVEMILDWWTFSWKTNNLKEIFKWYEEHKEKIIFSENTKKTVEEILNKMKEII